jgi:D-alanine-D-alanine ligase
MKIKIGVFFGGRSVEHEVSIISAIQAIHQFDREKYDVLPVYIARDNKMYVGDGIGEISEYTDIPRLLKKSQRVLPVDEDGRLTLLRYPLKKLGNNVYDVIDIAFPVVHGTNVEDGALQGYFRTMGVPFAGCDVLASAVGMDKYVMKTVLRDNGLPVVEGCCFNGSEYESGREEMLRRIEGKLRYPMIVKPVDLGSSVGIKKADGRDALTEAIDYALSFAPRVLVENAVEHLREINCAVLGDYEEARASECEEPVNTDAILSYEDKYVGGAKDGAKGMQSLKRKLPAEIPGELRAEIRRLAVSAFQALGCSGVARVDFLMDDETYKVWVNEVNTIPGSLSFYLWEPLGMKYPALLDELVRLALKRERERQALTYSIDTNILSGVKLGGMKGSKL